MAGRFLPQKDVDLITRITKELVGDKKNSKDGIINQEVVIYKPSLQESATNMYGEAAGGNKVYKNGVQNVTVNLLYNINKNTEIKIKTPVRISEGVKIIKKTMQGENFSSTLCTSTLNPIITECKIEP